MQKQTYSNLEIILVDDGSPDQCGEICDEYQKADSRIVVIHQKNQGVSAARNHGIEEAAGTWIAFVDADDWIEPDMLEKALRKAENEQVDMVVWNLFYNLPDEQKVRHNYSKSITVKDPELLEKINLNFLRTISLNKNEIRIPTLESPTCHIFKSGIIKQHMIQYDTSLKQGEDKLFNYEYHMHIQSFAYINEPLYHYRQYMESTTHTFFAGNADTSTRILKKYYALEPRIKTDAKYRNTYNVRVGMIAYFLIGKYFLNPNNTLPGNKFQEFKALMRTEPWKSAIPQMDLREMSLSVNKVKFWMLKHGLHRGVFAYYRLTKLVKKLVRI